MIGLSVYSLADTYFISSGVGTTGLTALNLALPVYSLGNGIGLMLGIGGAARFIVSRTMHRREASDTAFSTAVAAGLAIGIALALVGIFFGDKIAVLLGDDTVSFDDTAVYLKVILIFAPMFILNNVFSAFVKNGGAPRLAMAGMLSGSFFNIVFDYMLVFPCHLGMFGAVLATSFSPVVGISMLSVLSVRFFRRRCNTVLIMFFFSIEKALQSKMLSLLKGFGIVVPLSLLFARLFGMLGIWIAVPVTEALVLALGLVSLSRLSRAGNLMPAPDSVSDNLTASCIFR